MATVTKRWSTPKLGDTASGITASDTYDVSDVADLKAAIEAVEAAYPETRINQPHPLTPLIICSGRNGSMTGFNLYTVEVAYASTPAGQFPDNSNPLNEPAKYRLEWSNVTEAAGRDAYGNAILNSNGNPFDTDAPAEILCGMLYVERNEPFYDAVKAVQYANAVNDAPVTFHGIWNFDKGQACHRRYSCMTPITGRETYVTVQYAIELRGGYKQDADGYWDGFKLRILDQGSKGYYAELNEGPFVSKLLDGQATEVGTVLLNGYGKPLKAATSLTANDGYLIRKLDGNYAVPSNCPLAMPSTTIIENTGHAVFLKVFPEGIKLKNLSVLGL